MSVLNYKVFFDYIYKKYNTAEHIKTDPICFVHQTRGNREFIAFTSALFAYGNVKAMQKFLGDYFSLIGTDPLRLLPNSKSLKYRFQSGQDVAAYSLATQKIYKEYESLENLFLENASGGDKIYAAAERAFAAVRSRFLPKNISHGLNFLFAMPNRSASKRLNLFLRWMVRSDEVDFGLWKSFGKEELSIPLDTHIQRLCSNLGVIAKGEKGARAVEKVNAFFRELSPDDPAKYDFALTRLGIAKQCLYAPSPACVSCEDREECVLRLL